MSHSYLDRTLRPLIGITMGDPGGVGPEVIVKSLGNASILEAMSPVVIGDCRLLAQTARELNIQIEFQAIRDVGEVGPARAIPVLESQESLGAFALGELSATNGKAACHWIVEGARLANNGGLDAICTAPIAKEAMFLAGFTFPGHTELLAELSGGMPVRMMLAGGGLRVVLQTIHVPLAEVPGLLNHEDLLASIEIANRWGKRYLMAEPRIAVCGLNPHAGEGGHFGREEIDIIAPVIAQAAGSGYRVSGPYPADTVFHRMLTNEFDIVIAMYHDQALIPVKTLDFHGGVNLTLGLPIIRTSPDHGTAFNIAGQGIANASSMTQALLTAADLAVKKLSRN